MQTFLPVANFVESVKILDWRRLNKQRVEARQIYDILNGKVNRWVNHPTVQMWIGYKNALAQYHNECIKEWVKRGYQNNMPYLSVFAVCEQRTQYEIPWWFGMKEFHDSHKASLLAKNPSWYKQFNWDVEPKIEYIWPSKLRRAFL